MPRSLTRKQRPEMIPFSRFVLSILDEEGVDKKEFSKMLNLTESTLGQCINGIVRPADVTLWRIAWGLHQLRPYTEFRLDYLMGLYMLELDEKPLPWQFDSPPRGRSYVLREEGAETFSLLFQSAFQRSERTLQEIEEAVPELDRQRAATLLSGVAAPDVEELKLLVDLFPFADEDGDLGFVDVLRLVYQPQEETPVEIRRAS